MPLGVLGLAPCYIGKDHKSLGTASQHKPQRFFPNSYLGSSRVFGPDYLPHDPVQLRRPVPGKVPRLGEVLQGSGADT